MKSSFSPKEQLANCRLALDLWHERVKPEDVVPHLGRWVCGSQACFGGHLATWPEFRALGMRAWPSGSPEFAPTRGFGDGELFGDPHMFNPVGGHRADGGCAYGASDHEIVAARLQCRIAELESYLEADHV